MMIDPPYKAAFVGHKEKRHSTKVIYCITQNGVYIVALASAFEDLVSINSFGGRPVYTTIICMCT